MTSVVVLNSYGYKKGWADNNMKCYYCGKGIESGRSFIRISGGKNPLWSCTNCANDNEKNNAKSNIGEIGLAISRCFDKEFLM